MPWAVITQLGLNMNGTYILAALAIIVSSMTALGVAYLHRKQMRQIELYKLDPSVGLTPPASRLTYFVKSKADAIFGFGFPAFSLIVGLIANPQPLKRWDAIIISVNVALIFFMVVLKLMSRVQTTMLALSQVQEKHFNLIERIAKVAERGDG
jgi:hypothetical protein